MSHKACGAHTAMYRLLVYDKIMACMTFIRDIVRTEKYMHKCTEQVHHKTHIIIDEYFY